MHLFLCFYFLELSVNLLIVVTPPITGRMSTSPIGSHASIDILEELQLIAAQNLEKLDINKYYEVIRELGKGTYGKVDLVVHKIRGKHWNSFLWNGSTF